VDSSPPGFKSQSIFNLNFKIFENSKKDKYVKKTRVDSKMFGERRIANLDHLHR
jgi:hypothetical protein